ncbi:hypothetical protein GQ53DRAFT_113443 [Thozetella sp. PMI_491]|nr:hypothetical protein GQ53DRAFT_113443 [Thozetella sp. PMI_491]
MHWRPRSVDEHNNAKRRRANVSLASDDAVEWIGSPLYWVNATIPLAFSFGDRKASDPRIRRWHCAGKVKRTEFLAAARLPVSVSAEDGQPLARHIGFALGLWGATLPATVDQLILCLRRAALSMPTGSPSTRACPLLRTPPAARCLASLPRSHGHADPI